MRAVIDYLGRPNRLLDIGIVVASVLATIVEYVQKGHDASIVAIVAMLWTALGARAAMRQFQRPE